MPFDYFLPTGLGANRVRARSCYTKFASEFELLSEIHLSNVLILENLFGGPCSNKAAIAKDVGMPADAESLSDIMVSYQYTDATLAQVANDALNIKYRNRVHASKGLVEEHEQRVGRKRSRNLDTSPLTTRQADAEARAHVPDVQFIEQVLEFLLTSRTIKIVPILEDRQDVLFNRELAEDRRFLRQVAKTKLGAPVHWFGREVFAIEQDFSAVGSNKSDDYVKRRGLASTVGAKQTYHFAALDLDRQALDDLPEFEALGDFLDAQNTH